MTSQRAVVALVLVLSGPAWAQVTAPDAGTETKVEVSGVKDPELRPYRIMSRGLDAFDKHHGLAPSASLRFEDANTRSFSSGLRFIGIDFYFFSIDLLAKRLHFATICIKLIFDYICTY